MLTVATSIENSHREGEISLMNIYHDLGEVPKLGKIYEKVNCLPPEMERSPCPLVDWSGYRTRDLYLETYLKSLYVTNNILSHPCGGYDQDWWQKVNIRLRC